MNMKNNSYICYLFVFFLLLSATFAQNTKTNINPIDSANSDHPEGLEIVFVVDVSYSMKDHLIYVTPVIRRVFKDFSKENDTNTENNFHLITFADYATYIGPVQNSDSTDREIQTEMKKTRDEITRKNRDQRYGRYPKIPYRRQNTYPKSGLWEVLSLIEKNFIQKRGVLIFISDGEDSRCKEDEFLSDIKAPIKALENTGFSTFSFFIDTKNDFTCEKRMKEIGDNGKGFYPIQRLKIKDYGDFKKRVSSLPYNTPVSLKKHQEDQNKLNNELRVLNQNNNALRIALEEAFLHNNRLSFERHITQFVSRQLERLKDNLTRNHALYSQYYNQSNSRPPSWTWFVIGLLFLATAFFAVLWFYKEPPPQKIEQEQHLDILWGRLFPMNEGFKTINLGDLNPERIVTLPRDFPDLKFIGYNQNGRKAIRIVNSDPENWSIRIYSRPTYKKIKSRNFIDEDTEKITIKLRTDGKICCSFQYVLLDEFKNSCINPVWEPGKFIGRENIVRKIKENFLNKKSKLSYLISGLGNAGKTSLIKHLYHEALGKNKNILNEYSMALISYDEKIKNFQKYADDIFKQLNKEGDKPRKLLYIDEYDEILDNENVSAQFIQFLKAHDFNSNFYYIFTGRKGFKQLDAEGQLEFIPDFTKPLLLGSFESPESIAKGNFQNAINFLNSLLSSNGFSPHVIRDDAKIEIVTIASGFPFIIKEILSIVLDRWLDNYDLHPIGSDQVDFAARQLKKRTKDYLFRRIKNYENKKFPDRNSIPKTHVQISEILYGLTERQELKNEKNVDEIVSFLITFTLNEDIQDDYKKIIPEKLDIIEEMGFISRVDGKLIRMPSFIF